MKRATEPVANDKPISYAGHRYPPEVISYAVWLYFRFPLSLRRYCQLVGGQPSDFVTQITAQF